MEIESVCFDTDGTLIRNTDSVRFLCELSGNIDEFHEINKIKKNDQVSWIEADYLRARLIEGLDIGKIKKEFDHVIHLIDNIEQVLGFLKIRKIRTVLITAGPIQVADILGNKFGFDAVYGSLYEEKERKFTGRIINHLGSVGKLCCLKDFCAKNCIMIEHCVAIGDSESDVDIFLSCGRSIAINSTPSATKAASESIITDDLSDILKFFSDWLDE